MIVWFLMVFEPSGNVRSKPKGPSPPRQVDVAIIEVGMGGRDDATNVLMEPVASWA